MATWMPSDEGKVRPDFSAGQPPISGPDDPIWQGRAHAGPVSCKTSGMRITVLAGGVGAARFLRGLRAAAPAADVTVIGNTGDDFTPFGLHVSPDLDTVMYTLGGGISEEQGWGRADESRVVLGELAAYGASPDWFGLGDKDLATHILRTQMLDGRLDPVGGHGGAVPPLGAGRDAAADDRRPGADARDRSAGRARAGPALPGVVGAAARGGPGARIEAVGAAAAQARAGRARRHRRRRLRAAPAVQPGREHRHDPGRARHRRAAVRRKTVVGVSPIIGGAPVRGMADACLAAIGVETSAPAVAAHYGPELLDGWLVDEQDKDAADDPAAGRHRDPGRPLYMTDVAATAEIAGRRDLELAAAGDGGDRASSRSCRSAACRRSRPATTSRR